MRYKVAVVELLPVVGSDQPGLEVEGQALFTTTVEFKPSVAKLVAALTQPRVRKPRSAKG